MRRIISFVIDKYEIYFANRTVARHEKRHRAAESALNMSAALKYKVLNHRVDYIRPTCIERYEYGACIMYQALTIVKVE